MRVLVSFCVFLAAFGSWVTVAHSDYTEEWTSGNLGYGGYANTFYDIDDDGIVEVSITSPGRIAFYNGDAGYSLEWELFASPYDYVRLAYAQPTADIDGDGVKEVVVYRSSSGVGKIYVYDSRTHAEEWSSSEISDFICVLSVVDVDDDGKAEIIFSTCNFDDSTSHVYIYGHSGGKEEGNGYEMKSAVPIVHQNYPNPFYGETLIEFEMPKTADVNVEILNPAGQVIDVLPLGRKEKGKHLAAWKGPNNRPVSGIYFYRLIVDGKRSGERRKTLLLK
jgi:hypothetical protein